MKKNILKKITPLAIILLTLSSLTTEFQQDNITNDIHILNDLGGPSEKD